MRGSATKNMGSSEWFLLVFLSVLGGGAFFFGEVALTELSTTMCGCVLFLVLTVQIWISCGGPNDRDALKVTLVFPPADNSKILCAGRLRICRVHDCRVSIYRRGFTRAALGGPVFKVLAGLFEMVEP